MQTHTIVVGASLPQEQEAKQATTAKGGQEAKGNGGGVGGGEGQAGGESAAAEEKRADMPGVDEIEPEAVVSSTVSVRSVLRPISSSSHSPLRGPSKYRAEMAPKPRQF